MLLEIQMRDSRKPSSSLRLQRKCLDLCRFRQLSLPLPCRDRTNMSLQHKRSAWLFLSQCSMSELGESSCCEIQLCTSHASSGTNRICQLPLLAKLHNKCTEDAAKVHPLSCLHWFILLVQEKGAVMRETARVLQKQSQSGWLELAHIYKRWQSTLKRRGKKRERQLVTPSSKYFGMPPAILQR